MTFDEYQQAAIKTDLFGGKEVPITSTAFFAQLLGLVGETGEIAEKFKKIYRDKKGVLDDVAREDMKKELGDILWYLSVVSSYLNLSLDEISELNIKKLADRQKRTKLSGSGDNR